MKVRRLANLRPPIQRNPALGGHAHAGHSTQRAEKLDISFRKEGDDIIVQCREIPLGRMAPIENSPLRVENGQEGLRSPVAAFPVSVSRPTVAVTDHGDLWVESGLLLPRRVFGALGGWWVVAVGELVERWCDFGDQVVKGFCEQ
jgi:hypothetical protein